MEDGILRQAREGIFPVDLVNEYSSNYARAGGTGSFEDYYTSGYGSAVFRGFLKKNIIF